MITNERKTNALGQVVKLSDVVYREQPPLFTKTFPEGNCSISKIGGGSFGTIYISTVYPWTISLYQLSMRRHHHLWLNRSTIHDISRVKRISLPFSIDHTDTMPKTISLSERTNSVITISKNIWTRPLSFTLRNHFLACSHSDKRRNPTITMVKDW